MLPGVLPLSHCISSAPTAADLPSQDARFTHTIQTGESAAAGSHFSGVLLTHPGEPLGQAGMALSQALPSVPLPSRSRQSHALSTDRTGWLLSKVLLHCSPAVHGSARPRALGLFGIGRQTQLDDTPPGVTAGRAIPGEGAAGPTGLGASTFTGFEAKRPEPGPQLLASTLILPLLRSKGQGAG